MKTAIIVIFFVLTGFCVDAQISGDTSITRTGTGAGAISLCLKINKNCFSPYHPCGVAVSKQGKVAVSTYEGDNADGYVFVWKKFADFNSGKPSDFQCKIPDPEAVVFDNNERLFIASTSTGKIYVLSNYNPMVFPLGGYKYFTIDANPANPQNWNPRGMAIDQYNNLYVMCENLWPTEKPSAIVKVSNASTNNPSRVVLSNSTQGYSNALGIAIYGSTLFTTDLKASTIRSYTFNNNSLTTGKTLPDAGNVLDVTTDGTYVYFTNAAGYLVRWNFSNNETKNIVIGNNGIYAPWGLALYNKNLLAADAAHNKVQVLPLNTIPWQ